MFLVYCIFALRSNSQATNSYDPDTDNGDVDTTGGWVGIAGGSKQEDEEH